ncbi:MAG: glycosyltransferase family 1 protein [Patescibacteria group bacterium]|jgi:glycosyltransferase involved in cell wall biosynthesis
MRIGIDARFYGSIGKGLGRYTERLIKHLEKIAMADEFVIFLRKENFEEYQPQAKNFSKKLADFSWYSFSEQKHFPPVIKSANLDLMHYPHFNVPLFTPKPFIVTVHDLILTHFPTRRASTLGPIKYYFKQLAYKIVLSRAIQNAEQILTVSEFTKQDIQKFFGYDPQKITVTYEAVEAFLRPQMPEPQILEKYKIAKPYLLYVGNAYPHKNLEKLIEFMKKLPASHQNFQMVIVCKPDYFLKRLQAEVEASGLINKFNFPGFIPDAELGVLYRQAHAYIFPSLYEGFGIPPLEAMSQGTPVLSSNVACLQEVLGEAAIYFNPHDANAMIDALIGLDQNPNSRQVIITKGHEQVGRYSWDKLAETTLKIYHQAK